MTMLLLFIVGFIIFRFRKVRIKFKTFLEKGIKVKTSRYGVYCYSSKQGTGKTYSCVEFLDNISDNSLVYYNVSSIKKENYPGLNLVYYDNIYELFDLPVYMTDFYILCDEIFTWLNKNKRMENDTLAFLSQMRKRRVVFLTTSQEWLDLPIEWRRRCRFMIDCSIYTFGCSFLLKRVYNAEQMRWEKDANEYVAPLQEATLSKMQKRVVDNYDTYEVIKWKK